MCYFTCPFITPNSNSHSQQKALPKSAILSLFCCKIPCEGITDLASILKYFKGYGGAGFGVGEGVVVVC